MINEDLLSKTISYLRFPLIVGVVFIHFNMSLGLPLHGVRYGLDNPDWYFFVIKFTQVLASIGVPMFFLISGFLFFYQKEFNKEMFRKKLFSRAKTLLVPYILWNLIAIIWELKRFLPFMSGFYQQREYLQISLIRIIRTFFYNTEGSGIFVGISSCAPVVIPSPIDGPLWYVRDLMLMVILSPIIYWLIKKTSYFYIVVICIVWFGASCFFPDNYYLKNAFFVALFFYSWGAFFSINKINFVSLFRHFKYVPVLFVAVAIVDAWIKGLWCHIFIHKVGILLGMISIVVVVSKLIESGRIRTTDTLANCSFFIYASHILFIGELGRLAFTLLHIQDNNPFVMIVFYICIPFVSVLICFLLYLTLKRLAPGFCNILTGGR